MSSQDSETPIPGLCWATHPEAPWHCTEPPHTDGDHYHAYSKTRWNR